MNFVKLNSSWTAKTYLSGGILKIKNEIIEIINKDVDKKDNSLQGIWKELVEVVDHILCGDLLITLLKKILNIKEKLYRFFLINLN